MFDAPAKQEFVGKCEPISDEPVLDEHKPARRKLLTFILAFIEAQLSNAFTRTQLNEAMAVVVDKTRKVLSDEFGYPAGADHAVIQELANRMRATAARFS